MPWRAKSELLPSISGKNLKLPESGWRRDGGTRDEDKMKGGSSGVLEGQKGGVRLGET